MKVIPTTPTPSQSFDITLNQQNCTIELFQKFNGLYMDLYIDQKPVVSSVILRDRVKCVRQAYLGFSGDIAIMDTQGTSDPDYTGLNSRFVLMYLEPGIDV